MEFAEVLRRRRMVRRYRPTAIDPEVIFEIGAAALRAPSAGNSRGQRVVVITDRRRIETIAAAAGETHHVERGFQPWVSSASGLIVIGVSHTAYRERYSETDKRADPGQWSVPYWWVDAGAALMAVLLAAVDKGLGAGFLGEHAVPGLGELVGFPVDTTPIGVVTVGAPAPDRRSSSLDRISPSQIGREMWSDVTDPR